MLLGIYGGSFDPPHRGHVALLTHVLAERLVDRVVVVPVYRHAFGKDLAKFEDRLAMCHLAFDPIAGVFVSSIESSLSVPNYTLHTILAIQREWPDAQLRLIVGADVLADLPKWHRIDEVKRLAPLLVLGRVGFEEAGAPRAVLPDVSSSDVRRLFGRSSAPELRVGQRDYDTHELVPEAVAEYVTRRSLYRDDGAAEERDFFGSDAVTPARK